LKGDEEGADGAAGPAFMLDKPPYTTTMAVQTMIPLHV